MDDGYMLVSCGCIAHEAALADRGNNQADSEQDLWLRAANAK